MCLIHVSLVPVLGESKEQKTKPTQHSVMTLRSLGLAPDLLAVRSTCHLEESTREKLALFCHVTTDHILNLHDVSNIWHVPLMMEAQGGAAVIIDRLKLSAPKGMDLRGWGARALKWDNLTEEVKIAMVGKYTGLTDSYLSVIKALQHAAIAVNRKLVIVWIEASKLEPAAKEDDAAGFEAAWAAIKSSDGILVPGGFGDRGVEGKILASKYARESGRPYLGICLGMQVIVIDFARHVLGLENANSTEFDRATPAPAVVFMPEGSTTHMGGTMRLGSRRTMFMTVDCVTAKLYHADRFVDERHRHRYEVNPDMVPKFEESGLRFVGRDETGRRMEICELSGHPYFVGCQFHPEFKSRPGKPSGPFLGLLLASTNQLDQYMSTAAQPDLSLPAPPDAKALTSPPVGETPRAP
mmetsp:Transcript_55572/g.176444  ORF Transcript_55572/g.176444 Transcript_55572/m.176444 type:complete len:411 (+) Transcript_55572:735-1967(+)